MSSLRPAIRRSAVVVVAAAAALALAAGPALASINPTNSASWGTDGTVWALARIGDVVYIGGDFSQAIGPGGITQPRAGLAAANVNTGDLTTWAPKANGIVYALAASGSTVFAGGEFTSIDGVSRSHIAAIGTDGSLPPWQASADARVRGFAVAGSTLYVAGAFVNVTDSGGSAHRRHIAALDLSSTPLGARLPFHPQVDRTVRSVTVLANGNLVIGGVFESVNKDSTQRDIAELTPSGQIAAWHSRPNNEVWSVAASGNVVAVGVGGGSNALNLYDAAGNLQWSRTGDGDVQAVAWAPNGEIIAGGHYGRLAGLKVPKLSAFSPSGQIDTSWIPRLNAPKGVWAVLGSPGYVHAGGAFTMAGGKTANHFAQFAVT